MKETLGQYLRRKREAHLISIQEISHSTGISMPVIKALEEDKFHLVPRPEMIVKCLKQYAAYVSLDKKEVLNRYKTQCASNLQNEYNFPRLSTFSEGGKPSQLKRRVGRFSRKQIIEGIFWAGIIIWAFILVYLYVHVLSLKKTGMLETQEIVPSKEARQEASIQGNHPIPPVTYEKNGSSPVSFQQEPSRNAVPVSLERQTDSKRLSSQASGTRQVSGKGKAIGNRKSKLYHLQGMKYFHKVKPYNRIVFSSEAEAIKAGYVRPQSKLFNLCKFAVLPFTYIFFTGRER